jgi:polypeptide N-acetylgalactosaminyltransferase
VESHVKPKEVVLAPPEQQDEEGAGEEGDEDQNEDEKDNEDEEDEEIIDFWAPKKYGPKAVLRSGVLGNFEPVIHRGSGPGEGGDAVYVSMSEKDAAERSVREFGFNMVASDKISMNRTIPDTRMEE